MITKSTTYLVAIPLWALDALINIGYRMGRYPNMTKEQSKALNDWLDKVDKENGRGFICHVPEDEDQPNTPMIPAFGEICDCALCYFTILH